MKKVYVINFIPKFTQWSEIFTYFLGISDNAQVVFQGSKDEFTEDFLNVGKNDFLHMEGITLLNNPSMEGSFIAQFPLTDETRTLFKKYVTTESKLWDFKLLRGNNTILAVQDFSDGRVCADEHDVEALKYLLIDWSSLEQSKQENDPDIQVESFSQEDLNTLAANLTKKITHP